MKSTDTSQAEDSGRPPAAELLRSLPPVGQLLEVAEIRDLCRVYGRDAVRVQVRRELDGLRRWLVDLGEDGPDAEGSQREGTEGEGTEGEGPGDAAEKEARNGGIRRRAASESSPAEALAHRLQTLPRRTAAALAEAHGAPLRRVINATGVFLHTNLGRAALPAAVSRSLPEFLDASCDLEMSLESGRRANRNTRVEKLLCLLTGAEAAVAVNNNAAALVLLLQHTSLGREVIVSRGELVEIGGSFRIPSILETAGTRLREVGTTNRTRIEDYAEAVGEQTGSLLKVHPSNYRISGFVEGASAEDLVALGRERGLPVLVDEGSGLLRSSERPQLRDHDSLSKLVAAGVDAACGSGDKLVGGPQAGLIVGRSSLVDAVKKHPLYRALRPNRATLYALEAVLRMHLAEEPMPLDRLWTPVDRLRERLEPIASAIDAEIVASDAFIGGGAAPEAPIPGLALAIEDSGRLLEALRTGAVPVVGYVREGRLILDLRTVDPKDDSAIVEAVRDARERLAGAVR